MVALGIGREGYRTLLLEKQKKIGNPLEKIDITEDFEIQEIIKKYNIKSEIISNTSYWHAGGECFKFQSKIKDLFFLRGSSQKSLENQLFNQAKNVGVETIFSSKFRISDEKIKINSEQVNAKVIIGAEGVDSAITKYCYPKEKSKIIDGYGQSFDDLNLPIGETHIFFNQDIIPGGYVYAGRTPTIGTIIAGGKNRSIDKNFEKIKKTSDKLNDIIGKRRGKNIYGRGIVSNIKKRVYKNIILVGDAARVSDPLFLYGVRPALISGDCAVKTTIDFLENEKELEQYDHLLKAKLLKDYYLLRAARNVLEDTKQDDLEFIIKNLNDINKTIGIDNITDKPINSLKVLSFLLRQNPYIATKLSFKVIKSLFEVF